MAESMTGFGHATAGEGGIEASVEVRSVNGRYVEVMVRSPRELNAYEVEVQNRARSILERGKISVSIQIQAHEEQAGLKVNEPLARAYAEVLDRLRLVAGINEPIEIDHLLQLKDVLVPTDRSDLASEAWPICSRALDRALDECRAMRRREGAALADDISERLKVIEAELSAIEKDAPRRVTRARDVLRLRLAELLNGEAAIDNDRLEMEVALLADRLDISEECVRLRSHLDQFRDALREEGHVGRRLNFLSQEVNREVNTIASKANDAAISHRAVTMKEELEKIREQIQNLA